MRRIVTHRFVSWTALVAAGAALLSGCVASPTVNGTAPVVVAEFEILDLHSTTEDPISDGTCQTGATVQLRAYRQAADGSVDKQSHDPQGQPVRFMWTDEVDYADGTGRHPSFDWGLGAGENVIATDELALNKQLYTIAVHYVTLTVWTRDGRSASREIRFTVTACESCGT